MGHETRVYNYCFLKPKVTSMTDKQLNLAIHTEVEGYNREPILFNTLPDYCHNSEWCVQMIEKHRLGLLPHNDYPGRGFLWEAYYGTPDPYGGGRPHVEDPCLTRAVALAVLEITRRNV